MTVAVSETPRRVRVGFGPLGRATANVLLIVSLAVFVALAVGPRTGRYRVVTMLTNSMRPHIPAGSLIVVTPHPVDTLAAGQVITFEAPVPDRRVVTHRVVDVQRQDGRTLIRTKGDANSDADPWTALVTDRTVWRVQAVAPGVGSALATVRGPVARAVLRFGVPAAVLVWGLVALWWPRRDHAR